MADEECIDVNGPIDTIAGLASPFDMVVGLESIIDDSAVTGESSIDTIVTLSSRLELCE